MSGLSGNPMSGGYSGYSGYGGGGFSGMPDKGASGVFSPLQSPLSSPRINYPPIGFNPTLAVPSKQQLPPLSHPAQTGGTGPTAGSQQSTSSFVGTFPGQTGSGMYAGNNSTTGVSSGSQLPPRAAEAATSSSANSTYEQEVERMGMYARTKLDTVMKEMLMSLFAQSPVDPVQYMITFLTDYQKKHPAEPPNQLPYLGVPGGMRTNRNRRSAVSAEPLIRMTTKERPNTIVPKSEADKARIRAAVSRNFLFESLDASQMDIVIDAMELKEYKATDNIITQGMYMYTCQLIIYRPHM